MQKLLVTGSRTSIDREYVYEILDDLISDKAAIKLIHGGAMGVDQFAHDWFGAKENEILYCTDGDSQIYFFSEGNYRELILRPNYLSTKNTKFAPIVRNLTMVKLLNSQDIAVAIWDGTSPGTKRTIEFLEKHNVKTFVFKKD